jgi:hypothetical protein
VTDKRNNHAKHKPHETKEIASLMNRAKDENQGEKVQKKSSLANHFCLLSYIGQK